MKRSFTVLSPLSRNITRSFAITLCAVLFLSSAAFCEEEPPKPATGDNKPEHKHTNALIHEKSPYLLQHAHNPINWLAWSKESLARAKREDKLIFLSIGYSTCHWCHVMEKECFEDAEVAALLNKDFICIKVDREELPDVDNVYMSIAQGLGTGGGWPLTVVMTPQGQPFFAGTYIPKHRKYGIPGLMTRLPQLVRRVRHGGEAIEEAILRAQRRIELLNRPPRQDSFEITDEYLDMAFERLMGSHDPIRGGFGMSMKFPRPHQLLYLISYHKRTDNPHALAAVKRTLDWIRRGGIYDQVGYGIHRYATDRLWKVPHFEKMLYDQAQLAMVCAEYSQLSGRPQYRRMTEEMFEYVLRDLTLPEGGFCSAEDADSEGEEGKFYLWTTKELQHVLADEQFATVSQVLDIHEEGNWVDGPSGEPQPTNILYMTEDGEKALLHGSADFKKHFEAARVALLKERGKRVRPQRDDKVLADWNGLMIASLARGGRLLGEKRYIEAAAKAFDFVDTRLRDDDGRLLHRWYRDSAAVPAYLDDHVFLAWGAIELYKATYDPKYLLTARSLMDEIDKRFGDNIEGGYFLTAHDAPPLPVRPKKYGDMEVPSGNAVATLVFSELFRLTGEPSYEDLAAELERLLSRGLMNMPSRSTQFGVAIEYRRTPGVEVVIVGPGSAKETKRMLALVEQHVSNQTVTILLKDTEDAKSQLSEAAPFTKNHELIDGKATAYVCRDRVCQRPTTDPEAMLRQLEANGANASSQR
jgi:uncharacterized protein YyaL (SSP411 family)